MAFHPDHAQRFKGLTLDTSPNRSGSTSPARRDAVGDHDAPESDLRSLPGRLRNSMASHHNARATPPMNIPTVYEHAVGGGSADSSHADQGSYMERFMRERNPSISFSNEVMIDSGQRQRIDEPLERLTKYRSREHRSHSESHRDHFDPVTGRHYPRSSNHTLREQPHVGEARFPLLQRTVDELAQESGPNSAQATSLTTASTVSSRPGNVATPREDLSPYPQSPTPMSPTLSINSPSRSFRRTASERWRSGEKSQDFFSQARSLRSGGGSWRNLRQNTATSAKSPNSAASSFLHRFSMGSGGDDSINAPAMDAEGQTVGDDYVLGKQIGFGGYSIVREVTQLSSGTGRQRKLAVKIVRRNIEGKSESENDAAQAEFEHEVELWRFLSHPNILPLEAVYKLDEATFCFIPLVDGGTLFDLVRNNRSGVSLELTRSYTYQLASALRYLHLDARVVHRDVKLENVLVNSAAQGPGKIQVCDFGMAEWISSDDDSRSPVSRPVSRDRPTVRSIGPAESSTAAFAGGSLEYAAPEVVQRATARDQCQDTDEHSLGRDIVSPAVDIWAFGVCLFTMIMGKRPFSDGFMPRVVMAILAAEWDVEGVRAKLAGDPHAESIIELLEGCLEKDVSRRMQISEVMESAWYSEERRREAESSSENDATRAWRL